MTDGDNSRPNLRPKIVVGLVISPGKVIGPFLACRTRLELYLISISLFPFPEVSASFSRSVFGLHALLSPCETRRDSDSASLAIFDSVQLRPRGR